MPRISLHIHDCIYSNGMGISTGTGTHNNQLFPYVFPDKLICLPHAHHRAFHLCDPYIRYINSMGTTSVYYKEGISNPQICHIHNTGFFEAHLHCIEFSRLCRQFIGLYRQCKTQLHFAVIHCIPIGPYPHGMKCCIEFLLVH